MCVAEREREWFDLCCILVLAGEHPHNARINYRWRIEWILTDLRCNRKHAFDLKSIVSNQSVAVIDYISFKIDIF